MISRKYWIGVLVWALGFYGCTESSPWGGVNDSLAPITENGTSAAADVDDLRIHDSVIDVSVDLSRDIDLDLSPDSSGSPDAPPPLCPTFADPLIVGLVTASEIREASGLVASRKNPGVLWTHNDSGGKAEIYALTDTGQLIGTFALTDTNDGDWEDIATGPGPVPGEHYLYIGDIGDNDAHKEQVYVHRVAEPVVSASNPPTATVPLSGTVTFTFQYAMGPEDAETLLVDPKNGDIYIVTKNISGTSNVYHGAAPHSASTTETMQLITTLSFGVGGPVASTLTTGGDISPAGDEVLIRSYTAAFIWKWSPGMSLTQCLSADPCPTKLALEPQGEAICFAANGEGYFTVSELQWQPLYYYARQ